MTSQRAGAETTRSSAPLMQSSGNSIGSANMLALPMLAILVVQTIFMALYAIFVTWRMMGKNYDAAVLAAGHCGFGLGATPTAIANMQAITERFGPSHMAFLVVPMVGAFFIDIVNALVIKLYLMLPIFAG